VERSAVVRVRAGLGQGGTDLEAEIVEVELLAEVVTQDGFTVNRDQFNIAQPIKTLGLHEVPVVLHPEVEVKVTVNIARSPEEAERQARGESTTTREEFNLDDLGLEVGAALAEAGPDADDR
jgi:large subunit ribosomal protein L9